MRKQSTNYWPNMGMAVTDDGANGYPGNYRQDPNQLARQLDWDARRKALRNMTVVSQ